MIKPEENQLVKRIVHDDLDGLLWAIYTELEEKTKRSLPLDHFAILCHYKEGIYDLINTEPTEERWRSLLAQAEKSNPVEGLRIMVQVNAIKTKLMRYEKELEKIQQSSEEGQ